MAAARNRPRAPLKEEGVNHEESELWYKIRAEILSSKEVHEQALVLENEIEGYKAKISARGMSCCCLCLCAYGSPY